MKTYLENYTDQSHFKQLLKKLGASKPEILAKEVKHFTTKEAEKRDKIVVDYFGEEGINRIVNAITKLLLANPKLKANAKVLDVGAGSGFFTIKIAQEIRAILPCVSFYGMDITPAMLLSLKQKNARITPFVGIAENIQKSIEEARRYVNIPKKFDATFSTLMLHHSTAPEKVFKSLQTVLKKNGKAIIIDLCEHGFKEFKTEMGDLHLGFKPEKILEMAQKYFRKTTVEKLRGICCESSGRSAELFVAFMQNC